MRAPRAFSQSTTSTATCTRRTRSWDRRAIRRKASSRSCVPPPPRPRRSRTRSGAALSNSRFRPKGSPWSLFAQNGEAHTLVAQMFARPPRRGAISQPAFDARPGARSQALVARVEFRRQVEPRANLGGRVERRVVEDLRTPERPRRKIVVAVVNVVGDVGDHVRVEDEVDEGVRRARMGG